jgi:predicted flap endonuclease-1-like 5' DNA nuclease
MPAFNQDPISRSRGVRSSARAHLARLREDRLQKRQAALPAKPTAAAVACDPERPVGAASVPGPIATDAAIAASEPAEAISIAVPHHASQAREALLETTDSQSPAVTQPDTQLPPNEPTSATADDHDLVAIRGEPPTAVTSTTAPVPVRPPPAETPFEEPELPKPEAVETVETDASQGPDVNSVQAEPSDLAGLPGAGPGLIWLLKDCGVTCLAELAAADAAELSQKLGLVGQLLDLDHWIDHARANS